MSTKLGEAPSTKKEEKSVESWTTSEKENSKKKYGVEIMIDNGT